MLSLEQAPVKPLGLPTFPPYCSQGDLHKTQTSSPFLEAFCRVLALKINIRILTWPEKPCWSSLSACLASSCCALSQALCSGHGAFATSAQSTPLAPATSFPILPFPSLSSFISAQGHISLFWKTFYTHQVRSGSFVICLHKFLSFHQRIRLSL